MSPRDELRREKFEAWYLEKRQYFAINLLCKILGASLLIVLPLLSNVVPVALGSHAFVPTLGMFFFVIAGRYDSLYTAVVREITFEEKFHDLEEKVKDLEKQIPPKK